jgi:hypothetical protein
VSLSGIRSGERYRLQWKVAGTLCGTPTYEVFSRTGGVGAFTSLGTTGTTAWTGNLIGPAGKLNEFYVAMHLNCAIDTQSNTLSFVY